MGLFNRGDHPTVRFQMREDLISFGDDYWIEDHDGHKAFRVDGKALRIRDTWRLEDASGNEVATIRERKLIVRDSMTIEVRGKKAVVKKKLVSIRDKFHIEMGDGPDLEAHGDIVDHEYKIDRDGDKVAECSKKWFRMRDTYGIEVDASVDPALIIAITVAIDALSHND